MKRNKQAIETKTAHVLEEARVLLPGTQILLAFQFTSVFQQQFHNMAEWLQYLHLAGLGMLSIAIIMLFSIVSYHRIVEKGRDTEQFHQFSHKMLIFSLLFVGAGLSIAIFIITAVITQNNMISTLLTLLFATFAIYLWFGYTWLQRKANDK